MTDTRLLDDRELVWRTERQAGGSWKIVEREWVTKTRDASVQRKTHRVYFAWNDDGTIQTNEDGSFVVLKRTKINEDGSESLIAESQLSRPGNPLARFP